MPMKCMVAVLVVETNGTWMRMYLKSNGKTHSLWRAVDQDGNGLDILVQSRRNQQAAQRFFRNLLTGLPYGPRVMITDQLKRYGAAKREILVLATSDIRSKKCITDDAISPFPLHLFSR